MCLFPILESACRTQAKQAGGAKPPAPPPPADDKDGDDKGASFKAFGGKGYSLKG